MSLIALLLLPFGSCLPSYTGHRRIDYLKDANGDIIETSVFERLELELNGAKQVIFLRGENINNPILLHLHGGPGMPQLATIVHSEKAERFEKYFTVCYWDQRGAGASSNMLTLKKNMTVDQLVDDTKELSLFLKNLFKVEKIYLIGHSWGSYLGMRTISKHPEHYAAYIGVGQVASQRFSEKLAYRRMMEHALELNDIKTMQKLSKFDVNDEKFPTLYYISTARTSILNKYGYGVTHVPSATIDLFEPLKNFKGYTNAEKLATPPAFLHSLSYLWNPILDDVLAESIPSVQVPVLVVQGKWDYTTSYTLAKDFIERLDAPIKEFITFEDSAHSPHVEQPEEFMRNLMRFVEEHSLPFTSLQPPSSVLDSLEHVLDLKQDEL
ncbi:putative alpha/beta hydrolase [Blattamonas nauphoetae]|uniref:prolyl aminopeptidase n=1 Tax=Blattamonas nauphoetae TaxID=2049346 RepID=A0ABQ9XVL8_9EUKA|nr:putative alpha/beta hydrolase [Blattamonas nauphoetae]